MPEGSKPLIQRIAHRVCIYILRLWNRRSRGKYTEEELAAMDDTAIAKLDTGSRVMLKANVTILDAMEDVDLPIAI